MAGGHACNELTVHAALHLCRSHKHTVHSLHHIPAGPLREALRIFPIWGLGRECLTIVQGPSRRIRKQPNSCMGGQMQ